jgi:acyl carrier protein
MNESTENDIADAIKNFIDHEILDGQGADLTETTPLLDLGILSSFTLVALVSFLIDRYKIELNLAEISPDDYENIRAIAALVERRQALMRQHADL